MASTINASTVSGIVQSADTSGVLALQTGGTTALSINSSQQVSFTNNVNLPNTFGFKNRIINGDMRIAQRSTSSVTPANGFNTVDRWSTWGSQASKLTQQQNLNSVTPPAGFINYLGNSVASAVSVGASDYFFLQQGIEGLNLADCGFGTANAKTVTLSFQVYSSLTGTFGGSLQNGGQTRSYPFTYTISSANTWTTVSVTIPGDTAGTWTTTNTAGAYLNFGLGVGSSASGTANTWASANYFAPTGAVSVIGTAGATFYITGVQLEVGTAATQFEFRDYGRELIMCQRYYVNTGNVQSAVVNAGSYSPVFFPVAMRAAPTVSYVGSGGTLTGYTVSALGVYVSTNATTQFSYAATAEL